TPHPLSTLFPYTTLFRSHTGLVVPERVITKFNEFAHRDLTPNWLSSLPTVIEALCAKWRIELEPIIGDTWITVVLFGTSPDLGRSEEHTSELQSLAYLVC